MTNQQLHYRKKENVSKKMSEMITVDKQRFPEIKFPVELLEKLETMSKSPGVYLHKNKNEKIIYVGKAKNLRNRVRSYFRDFQSKEPKNLHMINQIFDTEVILVDNEAEAFILEDTLIKKHKPKYNIMFRDDKTYPYIKITNEEFPQIISTHKVIKDGAKYFGPYSDVRQMKMTLRTLHDVFKLRTCRTKLTSENIKDGKYKICLDYQIKKCNGVCVAEESKQQYLENIRLAHTLIGGKNSEVMKMLKSQMMDYSEIMEYEKAANSRNSLAIL